MKMLMIDMNPMKKVILKQRFLALETSSGSWRAWMPWMVMMGGLGDQFQKGIISLERSFQNFFPWGIFGDIIEFLLFVFGWKDDSFVLDRSRSQRKKKQKIHFFFNIFIFYIIFIITETKNSINKGI